MINNILVPVDGSEHAFKALEFAADLAEKYRATLHLLHVAQAHGVPDGLKVWAKTEHMLGDVSWMVESGAADNLLAAAKSRAQEHGAEKIDTIIEHGNVAGTICAFARSEGVDLIVMGTRGLGELAGLMLGSIANKVLHTATCTVITVR